MGVAKIAQERRLTQEQVAELLGVSARTFRRWTERVNAEVKVPSFGAVGKLAQ